MSNKWSEVSQLRVDHRSDAVNAVWQSISVEAWDKIRPLNSNDIFDFRVFLQPIVADLPIRPI